MALSDLKNLDPEEPDSDTGNANDRRREKEKNEESHEDIVDWEDLR